MRRRAVRLGYDRPMSSSSSDRSRFAIAIGRFHEEIGDRLVKGAQRAFTERTGGEADVYDLAGAFEVPMAALMLANTGRYAGIACMATVIRGETDHYDYVCSESARGIMDVQLQTGVPCAFGILTCHNMEQALDRSGGKYDRGYDWAVAVIEMVEMKKQLAGGGQG
jgi:6,7-dimethyl-8-ribityllumazine synthase